MTPNNTSSTDTIKSIDYDALKAYGLEYIQKIGNKYWTDFNIHDPGVTIFEALCFALTDLSYRTDFQIKDILTSNEENHPLIKEPIFPAEQIFSSNPTTCDEYRKFILEHVPGIRNVWVEAITEGVQIKRDSSSKNLNVKGFYNVYVELEDEEYIHFFDKIWQTFQSDVHEEYLNYFDDNYKNFFHELIQHTLEDSDNSGKTWNHSKNKKPSRAYKICYQNYIKNLLIQHRNLCEDFLNIQILEPIYIGLDLDIEITQTADYKSIIDKIYVETDKYISPILQYHTISELLESGANPEDIYQGELPLYGFIDINELKNQNKKNALYNSDIYNIIMSIDDVIRIKKLNLIVDPKDNEFINRLKKNKYKNDFGIELNDSKNEHIFRLSPFQLSTKEERLKHWVHKSDIQNNITFSVGELSIPTILIPTVSTNTRKFFNEPLKTSLPTIESVNRKIEQFYPIQKILPKVYNVNNDSISQRNTILEIAEKKQLKGYLSFFNQLLAEYLSKLSSINTYFSIDKEFPKPYFWDPEKQSTNISQTTDDNNTLEDDNNSISLQNKLLDHLISRFNDTFADYATIMYSTMSDKLPFFEKNYSIINSLDKKREMLKNYPHLSGYRAQGICYTNEFEISGVEKRILAKLGINNPNKRLSPKVLKTNNKTKKKTFLNNHLESYESTFGIHILEHLLFIPQSKLSSTLEIKSKDDADAYSFTVSIVIPGWLDICRSDKFRTYVTNVIREELPSHIDFHIYWINPLAMWNIENNFVEFLNIMTKQTFPHNHETWSEKQISCIKNMVELINKLSSSEIPTEDNGTTFVKSDKLWELVSDENEDTDIDYTDQLKL